MILEKYTSDYTKALEQLIVRIATELYSKKRETAEKWLDIFLNEKSEHCRLMGVEFLHRSIFLDCKSFENYFEFVEANFCDNKVLWEALIPVYAQYLLNKNNDLYKESVKKRLYEIKDSYLREKRIFLQSIMYYIQKSQDIVDVIDKITNVSFEKDSQILQQLDYYLEYKFKEDTNTAIKKLYDIYNINLYKFNEQFLALLPRTCSLMKQQIKNIMTFWCDKYLYGKIKEFLLSLDIFAHVIKFEDLIYLSAVYSFWTFLIQD